MTRHEGAASDRPIPNRIYAKVKDLSSEDARYAAIVAVSEAQRRFPRVSGQTVAMFRPIWGPGYFGITWTGDHVWYLEMGIHPFTMHSLAGKTIPMWINDPLGEEAKKNPKARTRTTQDGRQQILIFRRAANPGERKMVERRVAGQVVSVSVPRSYPGAPGRIARREPAAPDTPLGKLGGQIARGNVGVRWRHPGTMAAFYLRESLLRASSQFGLDTTSIMYSSEGVMAKRQPYVTAPRRRP